MPTVKALSSARQCLLGLVAVLSAYTVPARAHPMRALWTAYTNAAKSYPLRTNVVTGGVITVAGDTMAQLVDKKQREKEGECQWQGKGTPVEFKSMMEGVGLDVQRSMAMLGWGTVVSGFTLYHWFKFLDVLFPPERNTFLRVLAKVGVNQAGLAFPLNGAFFGVSTARRHDITVSSERDKWLKDWELKVRKDLPMTVVQSTSFWGPVQAINFCLVPPHARALYVNMAFFSWTSYLSLIAYRFPSPD